MNLTIFKSRSLALTSVFVIVSLIALGWIYSQFPADWFQPGLLTPALALTTMVLNSIASEPSNVSQLTLPATISLLTLFIATFITWRQKGIFIPENKYALFLIPLALALLMLIWGSYCGLLPSSSSYISGVPKPYKELQSATLFSDYWVVKPWYAKVISAIFYTNMVGLFGFACYIIRSKNWDGERWLAFWIITHDVVFVCFLCGMAEYFTTRPFFW